jgi:spermidine synthase
MTHREGLEAFAKKHRAGIRLFVCAFLTLYLELSLIRWASAEILYLGYFSNYVLTAAFLGVGLGFLAADRPGRLFAYLPQILVAFIAFVLLTRIDFGTVLTAAEGQLYWGTTRFQGGLPIALCLVLVFGGTVLAFTAISQETGRCFSAYRPLVAYSIDIAGSLAGIVMFTVHSAAGVGPVLWFLTSAVLIVILSIGRAGVANAVGMGAVAVVLVIAGAPDHYTRWSPYQKIEVRGKLLTANGIGHQTMEKPGEKEPIYDFPYTVLEPARGAPFRNALIIGAGSGTDVAYALHYGVERVDAVEIDPEIQWAGRAMHPARPYQDPRVTAYIDDGRSFMETTDNRYDLVIFALPDSLALLSTFSSIRLESFLFTLDSLRQASQLLTDDGVLVLYNYYRESWLLDKLASMLETVFGHPPLVRSWSDEQNGLLSALASGPKLMDMKRAPSNEMEVPTDDWPFLYMERRHLPPLYLAAMALFVLAGLIGVLAVRGFGGLRIGPHGPFFLMGGAFFLLETKSIVQFSLLFGATWVVNSLVFGAILVSVLAANWAVERIELRSPWPYFGALAGALVLAWLIPLQSLLSIEADALRYVVASVLVFAPIFFANLVFGQLFSETTSSATAFGWNILGTMVGAALEYTSLVLGYRNLTIAVAVLYAGCFMWAWLMRRRTAAA